MLNKQSLTTFASKHRDEFESKLRELVEIPSVSADPARADDVRRCGERACDLVREFGGEAEMFETGGHPMVFGRFGSDDGG